MFGQQQDVVAALAQRWNVQLDHINAVEKILTKLALGNHIRQLAVCCRQDTHVNRFLFGGTDRAHSLFLDDTQQFDLH